MFLLSVKTSIFCQSIKNQSIMKMMQDGVMVMWRIHNVTVWTNDMELSHQKSDASKFLVEKSCVIWEMFLLLRLSFSSLFWFSLACWLIVLFLATV